MARDGLAVEVCLELNALHVTPEPGFRIGSQRSIGRRLHAVEDGALRVQSASHKKKCGELSHHVLAMAAACRCTLATAAAI